MITDELLPKPGFTARRWTVIAGAVIIGLALVLVSVLILIGRNTQTTVTLVNRGDCRAQWQGAFNDDLADLLREAIRPVPDPDTLDAVTAKLKDDARSYQACRKGTDNGSA